MIAGRAGGALVALEVQAVVVDHAGLLVVGQLVVVLAQAAEVVEVVGAVLDVGEAAGEVVGHVVAEVAVQTVVVLLRRTVLNCGIAFFSII